MKNCKIVHLDDHKLITHGIEKLLEKIIPGCEYISFTDPADALNYMKNSIEQAATVACSLPILSIPGRTDTTLQKLSGNLN
ncbi:MAG: hypothetical protein ACXWV1_08265 [Chitinophagaceae bacterium]